MFLTKLCLINLLTRGGTVLSSLLGGHTPALPSRRDRDLQEVAENKKSVGREAGEDRPPPSQCTNYLFPPRGCRKLQAPRFGVGPSSRADPLGLSRARGLPGQAGPRLQGLLVLLELGPEARVGLGHRAGALHSLEGPLPREAAMTHEVGGADGGRAAAAVLAVDEAGTTGAYRGLHGGTGPDITYVEAFSASISFFCGLRKDSDFPGMGFPFFPEFTGAIQVGGDSLSPSSRIGLLITSSQ